jgi:hypothetical protein
MDMFSRRIQLFGHYFLIESEIKNDFGIYYKTNDGDYIGRLPKGIVKYDIYRDSLIFAQTKSGKDSIKYYIIDIYKDHDFAEPKDVVIGPINSTDFNLEWMKIYKLNFKNVIE